jgi:hypothetical protein
VKEQLQVYINSLSYDTSSFNLNLIWEGKLLDNEVLIVWHEPILDECWDQLEDALSGDELVTDI